MSDTSAFYPCRVAVRTGDGVRMEERIGKCVIIGAGELQKGQLISEEDLQPEEGDFCIAADGGFTYAQALGIRPDMLIGDMDSLGEASLAGACAADGICIRRLPVEKDDTDMLAAIKEGLARGYRRFALYGALGGSIRHTLANIQCLDYLSNHGAKGVLYGRHVSMELLCGGQMRYPASMYRENRRISVFAYGGDAHGVTERGLRYSLTDACVRQDFPIGVSNEFTDRESTITVREGKLLICVEDIT
ncbi:MAG: thiamine diphosphokinase [Roseburia sp.]|nr:thiamine diphosphokinase [Roseburia sp.]